MGRKYAISEFISKNPCKRADVSYNSLSFITLFRTKDKMHAVLF